ncbi:hypothetical protein BV505_03105, partial [Thermomonas haemolytica]|uniref:hypothetical protein n=1 Tax=Thermomonas haemolytica TaxID=141949 RepID=UPI003CE4D6E3
MDQRDLHGELHKLLARIDLLAARMQRLQDENRSLRAFARHLFHLRAQAAVLVLQALHARGEQVDPRQQFVQFAVQVALVHPRTLGRRAVPVKPPAGAGLGIQTDATA